MTDTTIRIASVVHDSIVDGPGLRYVLFVQGCPHRCQGCHNPDTHDPEGGTERRLTDILDDIKRNPLLTGVTLSGGEPMLQAEALLPLAKAVKEQGKSLWIYSGYIWEEILQNPARRALAECADVVVDGPFVLAQKNLQLPFRGSDNQRVIDVQKSLAEGTVKEKRIVYSV